MMIPLQKHFLFPAIRRVFLVLLAGLLLGAAHAQSTAPRLVLAYEIKGLYNLNPPVTQSRSGGITVYDDHVVIETDGMPEQTRSARMKVDGEVIFLGSEWTANGNRNIDLWTIWPDGRGRGSLLRLTRRNRQACWTPLGLGGINRASWSERILCLRTGKLISR